jgi:hypothetical protein
MAKMNDAERRKEKRINTKLYVRIRADMYSSWGLLADVSENGLFLRSNRNFIEGTAVDIEIFMPDNKTSSAKGIIRRSIEMPDNHRRYGLGVELVQKDDIYRGFFQSVALENRKRTEDKP